MGCQCSHHCSWWCPDFLIYRGSLYYYTLKETSQFRVTESSRVCVKQLLADHSAKLYPRDEGDTSYLSDWSTRHYYENYWPHWHISCHIPLVLPLKHDKMGIRATVVNYNTVPAQTLHYWLSVGPKGFQEVSSASHCGQLTSANRGSGVLHVTLLFSQESLWEYSPGIFGNTSRLYHQHE